jgi:CPA2 family monovalent cation:H+ antiporter-2
MPRHPSAPSPDPAPADPATPAADGTGDGQPPRGHAIIAGFGLAGREVANAAIARGMPVRVIELNNDTVRRCALAGLSIHKGDAADPAVLRAAGIADAALFAATMPNDHAVIEAVAQARLLNPRVRILARCDYTSNGMKAMRRGADEVVVAEQAVAREFRRLVANDPATRDG